MINSTALKFNELNKRERLLIAVTCGVVVVVLFFVVLIEPLMNKSSKEMAQIEQKERNMNALKAEVDAFSQALSTDPSEPVRMEVVELEKTDQQMTKVLQKRSINLMDPLQMGHVLETVLKDKRGITLQRLSSLPLQPLRLSSDAEPDVTTAAPVYLHGFEVVLRGGYIDIYDYLYDLEGLSPSFFWDSLEYNVLNYPDSEVTLRVHTLSAVEGWIGG